MVLFSLSYGSYKDILDVIIMDSRDFFKKGMKSKNHSLE